MGDIRFLPRDALHGLFDALQKKDFRIVGPTVTDGAIQYREIEDVARLPLGLTDDQAPGHYRLSPVDTPRAFAWATGPQALKPFLFAPRETMWRASHDADGAMRLTSESPTDQRPLAVLGVRACDLAALDLHDAHFLGGVRNPRYAARREGLFLIAVHCAFPADTCFCASTGDGPRADSGFDLALSELDDGYLVEVGTGRGQAIADMLPLVDADPAQVQQAQAEVDEAARRQHRQLPGTHLYDSLFARLTHPRWEQVGERCLACGNCTSVCPTCFCHAESDAPALGGAETEHVREWDSCFTAGHAHLSGYPLRPATAQRYRQWLTHKLGSWHLQYGRSGCVGCGRCITWCPAGIDLTEEAQVICAAPAAAGGGT